VQDYPSDALDMAAPELPASRFHLAGGLRNRRLAVFLICVSAVDYAVEAVVLIPLIADLKTELREGRTCLLISFSFLERTPPLIQQIMGWGKAMAKRVLGTFDIYHRGQFWGWGRTQSECRELMRRAGYLGMTDGSI